MSKKMFNNVVNAVEFETKTVFIDDIGFIEIVKPANSSFRTALKMQIQGEENTIIALSPNSDFSDSQYHKTGDTICYDNYQKSFYAKVVNSTEQTSIVIWETFRILK
tara:strand:- start:257 stop:577 length:321 start_codon:yes stop_codon:yes gene_type:complete